MKAQEMGSANIAEQIQNTEGKHSIFEEEVRKMSIPVPSVFVRKGGEIGLTTSQEKYYFIVHQRPLVVT